MKKKLIIISKSSLIIGCISLLLLLISLVFSLTLFGNMEVGYWVNIWFAFSLLSLLTSPVLFFIASIKEAKKFFADWIIDGNDLIDLL